MEKVEIIEQLKDDEKYYGDFGKQFFSNSDISALINNPSDYLKPMGDHINLLFGRAFHELTMFGKTQHDNFVEASTRNTKIYKEALVESGETILFLKKEYDVLHSLVQKFLDNDNVAEILDSPDLVFEAPMIGELTDNKLMWKGKADIVSDCIYDIKTTSSLSKFPYSSQTYNYDSQAYIYSTLFQKPMKFVVIEKGSGSVGIFETSNEAYERGREKVEKAEENFLKYFLNKEEEIRNFTKYGKI